MERHPLLFFIALTSWMSACAAQPASLDESEDPPSPQGLGPFQSLDEVEEALCPTIMKMPGAQSGEAGIEYCGFVYHTPQGWFSTTLASLPYQRPGDVRRCKLPDGVTHAQVPTALIITVGDFHSHPWPFTKFSEARWVQGRLRGDLTPTPGRPLRLSINGAVYDYRRILFSTRCDRYRYFPYTQEIFKHDHLTTRWDKIADVELTVDSQTGEIIRGSAKLLPGKDW